MRNRNYFIPLEGIGYVDEENASAELFTVPVYDPDMYFYLEKLDFSVSKAAIGGEGVCQVKDTRGNVVWEINVDVVKDVPIDFSPDGVKLNDQPVEGLTAVVSGALTQATVSVAVVGHLDRV